MTALSLASLISLQMFLSSKIRCSGRMVEKTCQAGWDFFFREKYAECCRFLQGWWNMKRLEDDQGNEQIVPFFFTYFLHICIKIFPFDLRKKSEQKVSLHRRGEETAACRGGRRELGGVRWIRCLKGGCCLGFVVGGLVLHHFLRSFMEQFNQWMLLLSCKSRKSQHVLETCGETLLQQPFGKVLVNFLPKTKTPCTKIVKTSIIGVQTSRTSIFVKVTRSASIECQEMKRQSGKVGSERWIGEIYRNMINDSGDIMWFSLILIFSVSFCVWRCWSHIFRCRVCHLNFMSNGQLNVVSTARLQLKM